MPPAAVSVDTLAVMGSERSGAPPRRRILEHPGRVAIVVVALLVVLNLAIFLVASSDTTTGERTLPAAIDGVRPEPGTVARLQDSVTADLRDGLTGVLVINGLEIPEDQLERNDPLGVVTFRPGPDKDFARWEPGDVAVQVLSWRATDERPPDPDSYSWSFRAS